MKNKDLKRSLFSDSENSIESLFMIIIGDNHKRIQIKSFVLDKTSVQRHSQNMCQLPLLNQRFIRGHLGEKLKNLISPMKFNPYN